MAIEFKLPASSDHEPVLVRKYALPQMDFPDIPKGTPKTLRAMVEVPGKPGEFYVLLGPKGYEKEEFVRIIQRHMMRKKEYPDEGPALGHPYDGIENLRPETEAAVEAFLLKQRSPTLK